MDINDRQRAWLRMVLTPGLGPATTAKLLEAFGDPERIVRASARELEGIHGFGPRRADELVRGFRQADLDGQIDRAQATGTTLIFLDDDNYPGLLKTIHDPPPILFVKGKLDRRDTAALAVVGSRRCSRYGLDQAWRFGDLLARAQLTVVSGLARGIDTAAHRGALGAGGRTLAVMGCGLGQVYPEENAELADQIAQNGAVISELPIDFPILAENFPRRNRIISGLSLGTLVVEAGRRSGAAITARLATEQGREVFAVPGRVDNPYAGGTNRLIQDGAKLVQGIEDILDELGSAGENLADGLPEPELPMPPLTVELPPLQQKILSAMDPDGSSPDDLSARVNLPISELLGHLTTMQLRGLIRQLPGQHFAPRPRRGG